MKRVVALVLLSLALLLGAYLVAREQSAGSLIVPKPNWQAELDSRPTDRIEAEAAELVRVDATGLVDMQPPEKLASAIGQANGSMRFEVESAIDPIVAHDVSVALIRASSAVWDSKQRCLARGGEPSVPSAFADYWLAVWPFLDRYIADGTVERTITRSDATHPSSRFVCRNVIAKDMLRVSVDSDVWKVRLTFRRSENLPELELFDQLMRVAVKGRSER